jgi:hypothetical protein
MVLLQVVGALQTGCNELRVVDQTILIAVNNLHSAFHVVNVYLEFRTVFKAIKQFFNR